MIEFESSFGNEHPFEDFLKISDVKEIRVIFLIGRFSKGRTKLQQS